MGKEKPQYKEIKDLSHQKDSCSGLLTFFLHKIDIFGKPITLTFNNNSSFNSNIGGLCTILMVFILIGMLVSEIVVVFMRTNTAISKTSKNIPIIQDPVQHDIGRDTKFNFAFNLLLDNGTSLSNRPEYATLNLQEVTLKWVNDSSGLKSTEKSFKPIIFDLCDTDFDIIDSEKSKVIGLDKYYCPKNESYSIMGSFYSDKFIYLKLDVIK